VSIFDGISSSVPFHRGSSFCPAQERSRAVSCLGSSAGGTSALPFQPVAIPVFLPVVSLIQLRVAVLVRLPVASVGALHPSDSGVEESARSLI